MRVRLVREMRHVRQKLIPLDITLPTRITLALMNRYPRSINFNEVRVTKHRASIKLAKRDGTTVYYIGIGIYNSSLYIFCSLNKQYKTLLDWLSKSLTDIRNHLGEDSDIVVRTYTVEIRRSLVDHKKRKYITNIEFRRLVNELDRWIKYLKKNLDENQRSY
ncbi:MAG: hypothetical protein ABIL69_09745 [candidate division WOR-3 bacterium]